MAKNDNGGPTPVDVVKVPRAKFGACWERPFSELWDEAAEGNTLGLSREPHTTNCNCDQGFALLRRGPDDKAFLLRQNW